jgi:hypothetical protein
MSRHLTIISYPPSLDPFLEGVAFAANNRLPEDEFVRCENSDSLEDILMDGQLLDAALQTDIRQLDLVGHGSSGYFKLGGKPLFSETTDSSKVLAQLDRLLPLDAQVRILGCLTGFEQKGLRMLKDLSKALRGREVIGTTAVIKASHFGEGGLKQSFLQLISSRSAKPVLKPGPGTLKEEDKDAAARWLELLPGHYEAIGRGRPLAKVDFLIPFAKAKITVACDHQLIYVEDQPGADPMLYQWNKPGPVGVSKPQLLERFK